MLKSQSRNLSPGIKLQVQTLISIKLYFIPRGGIILQVVPYGVPVGSLSALYISPREKFFDLKNLLGLLLFLIYKFFYPPWRDHYGDPLWGPNLISFSFNVPLEKSFLISKTYQTYRFFWFTNFFIVTDGWWWWMVVDGGGWWWMEGFQKGSLILLKFFSDEVHSI